MFEQVLSKGALKVIIDLSGRIRGFYLAGGTGLALQLGHRRSEDFDFFSPEPFSTDALLEKIRPDSTLVVREGTIHCELKGIKLSFLFFRQPLVWPTISWRGVDVADWRDITAEKFRAISDRGSKKDFCDLYAVLQTKLSIEEACSVFKRRFSSSGINMYHVLRSITFFEEAEHDPQPILITQGKEWEWETVKTFFEKNVQQFKDGLMP